MKNKWRIGQLLHLAAALGWSWFDGADVGSAQEVAYFRHDHGVAGDAHALPGDWATEARLVWKTRLPPGHSTPCVAGDTIYLTTFEEDLQQLATLALDRASGRPRWRQVVPTNRFESIHPTGSLATATPASDGQRVFVMFGSYGLLCYDREGQLLWEHRMGPFQDEFGAASSPILVDDLVITSQDHDIGSFVMALDQRTGEVRWRISRPEATRSYATPVVLKRERSTEVLVAGSLQLAAYDVATGEKRWWFDGLSRIVDCTPTIQDGVIYVATWTPGGDSGERIDMEPFAEALTRYDQNGDGRISREELPPGSPVLERFFRIDLDQDGRLDDQEWARHALVFESAQNVAVALEPGDVGTLPDEHVRWTYTRGLPTVPSSVVYRGVMTMVKDSGIITQLDADTGQLLQQLRAPGRGNYYASVTAGDGKLYLTSESGVLTVLSADRPGEIIASYDFGERIMATPVIAADSIFIRTEEALYHFSVK